VDSVIVVFGKAALSDVELTASALRKGYGAEEVDPLFLDFPYGEAEQQAELEPEEIAKLSEVLGGGLTCAIQIACRHGQAAQVALKIASQLMSKFKPAALDDDFGGLWSIEDVEACLTANPSAGIYALRKRSNLSLQRTTAPSSGL
jgi:hypothetical protein